MSTASRIVDPVDNSKDVETGDLKDLDREAEDLKTKEHVEATGDPQTPATPEPTTPKLPDKFQGKSVEEIVASYENLEKELGRKGNELGELRRMADALIQSQTDRPRETGPTQEEKPSVTDDDFLENPAEAVRKIVQEALKPYRQESKELKTEMTLQRLQELHPDMNDIASDEAFQGWVLASPVRTEIMQKASDGDFDHANEILSLWKETKRTATPVETTPQEGESTPAVEEDKVETAAAMASGHSSEAATKPKKIYRRSDLIRLKIEDPLKYEALQPEIMRAYAEKRVR